MKVQQLISSALLSASTFYSAFAAPVPESEMIEERATSPLAVTGVPNNSVQVRMELRTMQRDYPDVFNIYLLGLQSFKAETQTDLQSFYQISGIHGRPYVAWDGVTSTGGASGYGGGYCTHTSNLFLPWHRPYLALYEQALYTHLQTVAATFTGSDKTRYQTAATNFRMPYWDWAAAPPCDTCQPFPTLISQQYAVVNTPTGQQTILNPLFRYDFHPVSASDFVYSPFATWPNTKRAPTNWDSNATSQENLVASQISSNRVSFSDRLYNLFQNGNFSQFGNEAWITSTTANADSLESLHDVIHSLTGQNGDMTYLDYAAFDPVFWLHHTMIDRCFALYQVLYSTYVEPMDAVGSTFTYAAGTLRDVNSPLEPFYNRTNAFYTSANVKDITQFGYTYPELSGTHSASSVTAAIKSLYGTSAGTSTVSKRGKREISDDVAAAASEQEAATGNSDSYQWGCNIVSQKFQMNGSYAVYIFLGEPSENPMEWATDDNIAGIHGVFANFPGDSNEMASMDLKITGSIPLTTALVGKVASGAVASLKPSDVEPYLTKSLTWRIQMYDGTAVDSADVPDLSVTVIGAEVTPAASDDAFPTWGQSISYSNITSGKTGGHSEQYWSSSSWSTTTSSSSSNGTESSSETSSSSGSSSSSSSSWSIAESINYGIGGS